MIGSTGRNSGKTTLSTNFIKINKNKLNIIGLKVTTIAERDGSCPRGGEGCGICSSLVGNYDIKIEEGHDNSKDTVRLVQAGAKKVYWIRAHKDYLKDAYKEFRDLINPNEFIVCESNSLRNYVKPRVFAMIKNTSDEHIKPTAAQVIDQADIVLGKFRGEKEALEYVEDLVFKENK